MGADMTLKALREYIDSGELVSGQSLRPMIYSAKRIGAFDTRHVRENENELDACLKALQEKHHGPKQPLKVAQSSRKGSPSTSSGSLDIGHKGHGGHRHDVALPNCVCRNNTGSHMDSSTSTMAGSDSMSEFTSRP